MHCTHQRQLSTEENRKRDALTGLFPHQFSLLLAYATPTSHLAGVYILPQRVLASIVVILACATYPILGCPNRLSSVDRFLYSRCQSRRSCAWWRNIFKEAKPTRRPQWGPMIPSTTI